MSLRSSPRYEPQRAAIVLAGIAFLALSFFGSGISDVIGKPIAPPNEKALASAITRPGNARYRMLSGNGAGQSFEVTTKSAPTLPDGSAVKTPTWVIDMPNVMTQFVTMDKHGLTAPALLLRRVGLFSVYQPIEPLLIFGVGPGESKQFVAKAAARHVSKPHVVAYGGQVTVTYRNLGAYEIKTPAGTFPGLIIRSDYVGNIGPATLNESDLRIYTPEKGLIALSAHDRLQAFMIIDKKIVHAFILEESQS